MRQSEIQRKTKETNIRLALNLDGVGETDINTGVPFLDHMLDLLGRHGHFDLAVQAEGDLEVDAHHTVEDVGICLGQAVKDALGAAKGIRRYGWAILPMDETLATVAVDLGGRPYLAFSIPSLDGAMGGFSMELIPEFFQAFCNNAGANLHIRVEAGRNRHHIAEAIFKAFSKSIDQATSLDHREQGVPSTKGKIGD